MTILAETCESSDQAAPLERLRLVIQLWACLELHHRPASAPKRLLASLGERDQLSAAESKVAATAPNDEALNPTAGSARLNMEVESLAIAVSARRRRAHKRSREPQ